MTQIHLTDIVIIGAGPVGIFSIFQAGMLGLKCHVVDTLEAVGGQCSALYPEKPIYDIPGHPSILAQELVDKLAEQADPFKPVYHLGERVDKLEARVADRKSRIEKETLTTRDPRPANHDWLVTTSKGTQIQCKAIVIAAGCGAFGPNRPPMAGIEAYEGRSVFYLVRKKEDFRGKRVVIAGGGDSAVDWAVALADIASHIAVVHRRPKFRAAPESVSKMEALAKSGKIEMVIPYQLEALEGSEGRISKVIVATLEGEKRALEADVLLPFFGLAMELGPIAEWGLNLNQNHIAVDPAYCSTNAAGIYAIGDIATYPGKLKLILTGFAEAASAIHDAYKRVHPDKELHFEYSTTRGVSAAA